MGERDVKYKTDTEKYFLSHLWMLKMFINQDINNNTKEAQAVGSL